MRFLYWFSLRFYGILIRFDTLFSKKAKDFITGRKKQVEILHNLDELPTSRVWFHFPSLGEFEQGRSVLEKWKEDFPEDQIIITFFSPSGYNARKDYTLASRVLYLPLDSPNNARRMVDAIRPRMAFFTKYDFWYYYIRELRERKIPIYFISAIFRRNQIYFKPWGSFFRSILKNISWFFVQDSASMELLESIGLKNISITGDTRFDRVLAISKKPKDLPELESFVKGFSVLVVGSSWPRDEEYIHTLLNQPFLEGWKCILVPHEVDSVHLQKIEDIFGGHCLRYSHFLSNSPKKEPGNFTKVIIIDQIGLLSSIYKIADIAYIGNGFGSGIHNCLEAAIFGKPVIFGPNYKKFKEARDLIEKKAAFSYLNPMELMEIFKMLLDLEKRQKAGNLARNYCLEHTGATHKIVEKVLSLSSF